MASLGLILSSLVAEKLDNYIEIGIYLSVSDGRVWKCENVLVTQRYLFRLTQFMDFQVSAAQFIFVFFPFVGFLCNQNWKVRFFGDIAYAFIDVSFGL